MGIMCMEYLGKKYKEKESDNESKDSRVVEEKSDEEEV